MRQSTPDETGQHGAFRTRQKRTGKSTLDIIEQDGTGQDETNHTKSSKERQDQAKQNRPEKSNSFLVVYNGCLFLLLLFFLDVDECSLSESFCDVNADYQNTRGSYRCLCKPGFTKDGKTCSGMMIYTFSNIFNDTCIKNKTIIGFATQMQW